MFRRSMLAACLLAVASCTQMSPPSPRTLVVFFTADSAALDQAAQAAITEAAGIANQRPGAILHVRGFAAPDAGSAAFNSALASTRALGVADALVQAGVPRGRISMETRGGVPYEMIPTESRRVEIQINS